MTQGIILIGGPKGGVGKTTAAVNLAIEYARRGVDVHVASMDPSHRGVVPWMERRNAAIDAGENWPRIPYSQHTGRVSNSLIELANKYELVIADAPGFQGAEFATAALVADIALIPFQPSILDLESYEEGYNAVLNAQNMRFADTSRPNLHPLVLLNRYDPKAISTELKESKEFIAATGLPMTRNHIPEAKEFRMCPRAGNGIVETMHKRRGVIQLLATELAEYLDNPQPTILQQ